MSIESSSPTQLFDVFVEAWLRNIRHSDVLTKALDELRRLATNQHQTISAVTLLVSQRTLAMFTDSAACQWADSLPIWQFAHSKRRGRHRQHPPNVPGTCPGDFARSLRYALRAPSFE